MNAFLRIKGLVAIAVCAAVVVLSFHVNESLGAEAAPVVINEVLASNSRYQADPQGQYDDWIELHNRSDVPVDLAGMYLTDDPDEPAKWQFPTGKPALTTIAPQGYLLVWADNDVAAAGLHAAFKLSAEGETVALFDRDGTTLIDIVGFGTQTADISYGRLSDPVDTWMLLTIPTPGAQNFTIYQGFVEKPHISPEHGFYDAEILVTITCPTEGAIIYYTTDGSEPYSSVNIRPGATATVYGGPISVTRTTCLRTAGVRANWRTSPAVTSTYLFVEDVIAQSPQGQRPGTAWPSGNVNGQILDYGMDPDVVNDPRYKDLMDDALLAIPSVSLVTDLANLFSPQTGIYVNAQNGGPLWERPASIELIYPDGEDGFQINSGVRIRGGYSRSGGNPKHAFRLFFDAKYGQPKLDYALFGDEGVAEFENVDLRTSQNYSWSYEGNQGDSHDTFVREVFSRDTQRDMGRPYTRSRYYHLYINGHYWGLFQTQERPEASYAASYFGGDKDDYDVIKSRGGGGNEGYDIEATDGTLDNWRTLWDASRSGFNNDATYRRVQGLNPDGTPNSDYPKLLDVDNLIDYMLCTYYVGDPDGPVSAWARVANNFYTIYNRVNPDGFKFFRHDAEHSLDNVQESRLFNSSTTAVGASFNQSNPLWMHTHLILHPEYKMRFADRVYKYFFNAGLLTPEVCTERFLARAEQIETAIIAESARWGDAKRSKPRTKDDDWMPDMQRMVDNYFPRRTGIVLNQFKAQGWYPNIDPPTLSPHGGHLDAGDVVSMQGGTASIWYTLDGSDPWVPGVEASTGGNAMTLVAENAAKRVLVPAGPVSNAWRGGAAFDDSAWIAGAGGVGYERDTGYEKFFTIDLFHAMYAKQTSCCVRIPFTLDKDPATLDTVQLRVRYDDGFVAYLNGVEVARRNVAGEPVWNSAASAPRYDIDAIDLEDISLPNARNHLRTGQNILAIQAMNDSSNSSDFLLSVMLVSSAGTAGSPAGTSANAIRYTGPITLDKSACIKARSQSGTTWSALNEAVYAVGPVTESLRISEIMYHPAEDPNAEYIELTNVGPEVINLNMVRFTKGIDYTFPSFELPPGGHCLLVKDIAAFGDEYVGWVLDPRVDPIAASPETWVENPPYGLPIVGQYVGSLSNAGEKIELLDAVGGIVASFEYDDNWFDLTDGLGFSLTVRDPRAKLDLSDEAAWRPSVQVGGSPGTDDK